MEGAYSRDYEAVEEKHWWFVARRLILWRAILGARQRHGGNFARALEIGCFAGRNIEAFQSVAATWVGIEPDMRAASHAAARLPQAQIVVGGFPEAGVSGCFDLVLLFDVLEHIKGDGAALAAIFDLLAPGGTLILTVPAYQWMWSLHDVVNKHHRRYTKRTLLPLLAAAGFRVVQTSYFNTILFPLAVIARWLGKITRSAKTPTLRTPPTPINWLLKKIFGVERFLVPRVPLPFGLSLLVVARRP